MPYQVFAERDGALSLMMAWMRFAMERSGSCISAMAARAVLSPSALFASAFNSLARFLIAAFSSAVHTPDFAADFCAAFFVELFDGLMEFSLRLSCWITATLGHLL